MLGHKLFFQYNKAENFEVYSTARNSAGLDKWFPLELLKKVINGVDADNFSSVEKAIKEVQPEVVINCIGIIKQLPSAKDPIPAITINSLLPHKLAKVSQEVGARLIHISTDCVFDGVKGNYTEHDESNATDLYGRTKFLGEVDHPNAITLRTSIIGHELKGDYGLVGWFLSQENQVKGFTRAIYTGFPTAELARIIAEYVIPNEEMTGLYQVSSEPISKYELLNLISSKYEKEIHIEPYGDFVLDRSLDSTLFRNITGYQPPSWSELVEMMYKDYKKSTYYKNSN